MLKKINRILGKKGDVLFIKNKEKINSQIIKTDKIIKYSSFVESLKLFR